MILTPEYEYYSRVAFADEAEIEKLVFDNYRRIFGDYSLILPKTKITTIAGAGTIPDAIVIDFEDEEWSIIEVERGVHGTWQHIAPQVSKQITAINNAESKERLIALCLDLLKTNKYFYDSLEDLGIEPIDVHGKLLGIFAEKPIVAIPIDDIPSDLEEWTKTLNYEVKIWRIEKYMNDEGRFLFTMPDDTIPNLVSGTPDNNRTKQTPSGSMNYLTQVITAGLLAEGDILWFEYGPKGQKKTRFEGVVRKDGVEVDGRVYSPSVSALHCINKVNPSRTTTNGWVTWKGPDGKLIVELLKKISGLGSGL